MIKFRDKNDSSLLANIKTDFKDCNDSLENLRSRSRAHNFQLGYMQREYLLSSNLDQSQSKIEELHDSMIEGDGKLLQFNSTQAKVS